MRGNKNDGRKQYRIDLHRRASGATNEVMDTPAPEMMHRIPILNAAVECLFDNMKPALVNPNRSPRKVKMANSSS